MTRIWDMEINTFEEDFWPDAMFLQIGKKEEIIYMEEIEQKAKQKNLRMEEAVTDIIKQYNPDNLALVFKSIYKHENFEETWVLNFLIGNIMRLECYEILYYEDKGILKVEGWEKLFPEEYPDEAIEVRRAMTYQDQ